MGWIFAVSKWEAPANAHLNREDIFANRMALVPHADILMLTGASWSFTFETIFMVMRNFPWYTQTGESARLATAR